MLKRSQESCLRSGRSFQPTESFSLMIQDVFNTGEISIYTNDDMTGGNLAELLKT